jgi:acylphosphatase
MRMRVRYVGNVQGVGFRATARSIAQRHGVTGWVRNDPDESVLLEVQGDDGAIKAVLDEIRRSMGRNIRSEDALPIADAGQEIGFEVVR